MKKIFESEWIAHDECADKIHVFQIESDDEFWAISDMSHEEKCQYFNVFDSHGYEVAPGGVYNTYEFDNNISFVTMFETQGLNI